MLSNVNRNLDSCVGVQCGYGFVWSEKFEKKKEGQWAQTKEIRTI